MGLTKTSLSLVTGIGISGMSASRASKFSCAHIPFRKMGKINIFLNRNLTMVKGQVSSVFIFVSLFNEEITI